MQKRNMELLSVLTEKLRRRKKKKEVRRTNFLKVKAQNLRDYCWKDRTCTYILWLFTSRFSKEEWRIKMVCVLNQLRLPPSIQKWDNVRNFAQKRMKKKMYGNVFAIFSFFSNKSDSPSYDTSEDTYVYIHAQT